MANTPTVIRPKVAHWKRTKPFADAARSLSDLATPGETKLVDLDIGSTFVTTLGNCQVTEVSWHFQWEEQHRDNLRGRVPRQRPPAPISPPSYLDFYSPEEIAAVMFKVVTPPQATASPSRPYPGPDKAA